MNLQISVKPQTAQIESAPSFRGSYLTYDQIINHPDHGICRKLVYRRIGNDNGVALARTLQSLKSSEPNVGMWPGDIVRYVSVHSDPDDEPLEEIIH